MTTEDSMPVHDIVIVDDDQLTLELIERTLRGTNLDIKCFYDPEQALEYLQTNTSRMLLIDQRMPRLSGLELLQHLAGESGLGAADAYLCSTVALPQAVAAEVGRLGALTLLKDVYRDKAQLLALKARSSISTAD